MRLKKKNVPVNMILNLSGLVVAVLLAHFYTFLFYAEQNVDRCHELYRFCSHSIHRL